MTIGDQISGLVSSLRNRAERVIARLARSTPAKPTPSRSASFEPPDPTKILLPDGEGDERTFLSGNLGDRLQASADDIAKTQRMLRDSALDLQETSDARDRGEKHLNIYGFRFLIGAAWLGLAAWLYQAGLVAKAKGQPLAGGIPVEDALVLAQTFSYVGGIAAAAAGLMIVLVFLSGNGSNTRLRQRGEAFGDNLAATARQFNKTLKFFRDKIADSGNSTSDIIPAVSQAHLTALEAKVFFRDTSFLTTVDPDAADGYFRDFIRRYTPGGGGYSPLDVILGLILGGMVGLGVGYKLFKTVGAGVAEPKIYAIMEYPWAVQALLFGAGLYLAVGIVVDVLSGFFENTEMTKARKEALDSVRSAYTAQEAPLTAEVVRQVEDVVEILRARLSPRGDHRQTNHTGASSADFSGHSDDIPPWRRRDSSVKFVDTGFQAAPSEWRVDAYEKKLGGKPGSKRGVFGLKNPRRD